MKKYYYLLLILLTSQILFNTHGQSSTEKSNNWYLGVTPGFAYKEIGESRFGLKLGGSILYNWDNSFIIISYTRLFVWNISFGDVDNNYPNSKFQRSEVRYGYNLQLSERHPVFKYLFLTSSFGLSISKINYFTDELSVRRNELISSNSFGIPLGIAITNEVGAPIFIGTEFMYQIISHYSPYKEANLFLMINIF